jgi:diguanylate cyclase (GGDEF)-like protein
MGAVPFQNRVPNTFLTGGKPERERIHAQSKGIAMQASLPPDEADRLDALESQKITDTHEDDSFDRIVRLACAATSMPRGAISFVEQERQWFKARQNLDVNETPRREAFCAHALHSDDVLVVEDATKDPRFSDNPLVTCENGIRFYAGAPLKTREGFNLGTLCVIDNVPRSIKDRDIGLLKDMAAIVVEEMELRRRAGTDLLTGLYTRRFLDEIAQHELARARRTRQPLTVALIDIDKFKIVNDTFGHGAGDAVLRAIGQVCRNSLRGPDVMARYGGEELVVLLPNTSLTQAAPVMERLRRNIMAMLVPELMGKWVVTASIGAAELTHNDGEIADVLARADIALYRAKETGRNKVELALAA